MILIALSGDDIYQNLHWYITLGDDMYQNLHWYITLGNDICKNLHWYITLGNDIYQNLHWYITLGDDICHRVCALIFLSHLIYLSSFIFTYPNPGHPLCWYLIPGDVILLIFPSRLRIVIFYWYFSPVWYTYIYFIHTGISIYIYI